MATLGRATVVLALIALCLALSSSVAQGAVAKPFVIPWRPKIAPMTKTGAYFPVGLKSGTKIVFRWKWGGGKRDVTMMSGLERYKKCGFGQSKVLSKQTAAGAFVYTIPKNYKGPLFFTSSASGDCDKGVKFWISAV